MLDRKNNSTNNSAKKHMHNIQDFEKSEAQQVMGSFIYSKHLQISSG